MHKDIGSLALLLKQAIAYFKVLREIERFMVNGRNIEILNVFWHGIGHIIAPSCSDYCANFML
jgi:hypothetical protein